ncbi:hypothetical protein VTJ49DRAFT_5255 [Mycothermus thermophilus]|uniref:Uncharacterized protein n=1 Tax=Humicola insolens TaxID=85995 RepID=A0ABR3V3I6_HUMIN
MPHKPTMDHSPNTSPRTQPIHQNPVPLALSDYIARAAPRSDTTIDDKTAAEIRKKLEALVAEPERAPVQDKPRSPLSPQQPDEKATPPPPNPEADWPPPPPPPPADWLAIRQQLLPRKNQGKKADWIRGWSHAVSMHGDSAYCACSETIENVHHTRRKSRSSDIAGNVRAIFQRTASPSSTSNKNGPKPPPEPEICPHCSRPSSPPPSPSAAASFGSEKAFSTRKLTKRLSDLFLRVKSLRPERSPSAPKPRRRRGRRRGTGDDGDDEDDDDDDEGPHTATWPDGNYQPPWAVANAGFSPASQLFITRWRTQRIHRRITEFALSRQVVGAWRRCGGTRNSGKYYGGFPGCGSETTIVVVIRAYRLVCGASAPGICEEHVEAEESHGLAAARDDNNDDDDSAQGLGTWKQPRREETRLRSCSHSRGHRLYGQIPCVIGD